jgi:hypothetical protein
MMRTTLKQLAERVQLFLQPGETVRQAFLGRGGPSPYAWVIMWLLGPFMPLRIVVVTDRAILLLRASKLFYARPKSVHALVARLPRQTRLGPVRGTWSRITLAGHELWVPRHFHAQITAADDALDNPSGPATVRSPADPRGGGSANVLLPLGLFATILGVWDASSALGDQERFVGALFALAGLTMLAAGISLLSRAWRDEWGRPLGIIAGAAGIGVGAYLTISQIGFPGARLPGFWIGNSWVFWLGVALMAAAAVALSRLPRPDEATAAKATSNDGDQEGGSKRAKTVATVLASVGAIATLLLGFVQFWYTNQYLPARGGAALAATGDLKELPPGDQSGKFRIFAVTLRVKNTGGTKVQVLSSLYTVVGVKVAKVPREDNTVDAYVTRAVPEAKDGHLPDIDPVASRYAVEEDYDLLKFDKVVSEGWYFEPTEEFSTRILVSVPTEVVRSYEFLRLSMVVAVAKGNRLTPDSGELPVYPPQLLVAAKDARPQYIMAGRPIRPLSQLHLLTRGAHAYASILNLNSDELLRVCISDVKRFQEAGDPKHVWDLCGSGDALRKKLEEFYGLTGTAADLDFGLARSPSEQLRPIIVVDK